MNNRIKLTHAQSLAQQRPLVEGGGELCAREPHKPDRLISVGTTNFSLFHFANSGYAGGAGWQNMENKRFGGAARAGTGAGEESMHRSATVVKPEQQQKKSAVANKLLTSPRDAWSVGVRSSPTRFDSCTGGREEKVLLGTTALPLILHIILKGFRFVSVEAVRQRNS